MTKKEAENLVLNFAEIAKEFGKILEKEPKEFRARAMVVFISLLQIALNIVPEEWEKIWGKAKEQVYKELLPKS